MSAIAIFCYGSLKRGYPNFERYCRGALSIEPAEVRGLLYDLPFGFPMLQVPDEDILAHGTNDPIADVGTQEKFEMDTYVCRDKSQMWIHGELMTFDDPKTRLPLIDRLEGFRPDGSSLYRRVLVYVYSGAEAIPAWCYVAGDYPIRDLSPTGKVAWP
ncbi:MAG: gamma-glutamylcyclotransferase family protein [Armatimonadota bacterium]